MDPTLFTVTEVLALLFPSQFPDVKFSASQVLALKSDPKLDRIITLLEKIMTDLETATAAIAAINDATNAQAATLTTIGTNLKATSDNIAALIAKLGTTVPADVLAGLQANLAHVQAVSTALQAQADFSTQLASQGAATPVPVPVPPAPPAPAPVPAP